MSDPLIKTRESVEVFEPDYRYASRDDIRAVTLNQLAKLEVDLHTLRLIFVANGSNPASLIAADKPIGPEIEKVGAAIVRLEKYFSTVLNVEVPKYEG